MGSKKSASHNVVIDAQPAEKKLPGDDAKIVQGTALTSLPVVGTIEASGWKWTAEKQKALKAFLNGSAVTDIARSLKVHRNTIRNWTRAPEFQARLRSRISEAQTSTKLRRIQAHTLLTNTLAVRAAEAISDPEQIDVNKARLFLGEHRAYTDQERKLFGDGGDGGGGGHGPMVNITLGGSSGVQPVDETKKSTARLAFGDFMASYNPTLTVIASTPQEAAVKIAEKTLQESNLIDIIREEDREELAAEAQAAEEAKRRR